MGLTAQSVKKEAMEDVFDIVKGEGQYVIALAGNPNTGKSTVFNYLTGLKQHTGNWPGKTVVTARGEYAFNKNEYIMVDLPGAYSLFTSSKDEEVARDFVCYGNYDAVVVVADATCLERNLNLVFQISEITSNVILCINLIDEAKKKDINIDKEGLEKELGVKIVLTAARSGIGMDELKREVENIAIAKKITEPKYIKYNEDIERLAQQAFEKIENMDIKNKRWTSLRLIDSDENIFSYDLENHLSREEALKISKELQLNNNKDIIREKISETNYNYANELKRMFVKENVKKIDRDKKIDDILTSKKFGMPIMLLILGMILWFTIQGANYPSLLLSNLLFSLYDKLEILFTSFAVSPILKGLLLDGIYTTSAWVISVMLPPMAIFFPLFTILEDLGYLPRVAFNMDHVFKKACAHGKQCLSMCMGLGCNAAGVVGCRIIDSPRERLVAILTNNFIPCNGRFPILIAISSAFFMVYGGGFFKTLVPTLSVTAIIVLGVCMTLLVSYLLSKTMLKGVPSTFTLELPPYRVPKVGRVLYSSIIDRTIFVLSRAVAVAVPAGAITWILCNIYIGGTDILTHISSFLNPLANLIGMDGVILTAFIVGIPANEIVLPVAMMLYLSTGTLTEFESIAQLRSILVENGWTILTALNVMLFTLLHWPCSTTLWTIKKETGSVKWTIVAFLLPTLIAFIVCFITATIYRMIV